MDLRTMIGLRPKGETASALRAAQAQAEAALAAAREREAVLTAQRGAILLDSDPETVERAEGEMRDVHAQAERIQAILSALPERITTAEARELAAELDAMTVAATRRAEAGASLMPKLEATVAELARLVEEIDAHGEAVRDANLRLREHGRERIAGPIRRAWPRAEVGNLGPWIGLPGPRGRCVSGTTFAAEIARAKRAEE